MPSAAWIAYGSVFPSMISLPRSQVPNRYAPVLPSFLLVSGAKLFPLPSSKPKPRFPNRKSSVVWLCTGGRTATGDRKRGIQSLARIAEML
jgi:hypothetical protein